MLDFTHLHVHSQFSILDGAASIDGLLNKAMEYNMDALALTDHGNLYGALKFILATEKLKKEKQYSIKPIIGCEFYVARRSRFNKSTKEDRSGHHLILLAKNLIGYRNLSTLSSLAFKKENFYYRPRIDKELLREYHEGLIASSACLAGEIPSTILNHGEEKAEAALQEFLDIFGDDFYLELQNHGLPEQNIVNKSLLNLATKYNVKVIATNDVHFINKEDYDAHHILICLNTGKDYYSDEGLTYSGNEYLKSPEEMAELFKDFPEALANTREIVDKIEDYKITTDKTILPVFSIPQEYNSEIDYLRFLTYEGAKSLYPEITPEIRERLDFELSILDEKGFAGYFLIVQDFVKEAKKMDVVVGPGRGSAAGSAIAYCTGITNVDPIKYNLLFERFLNPERTSMPDIDIDFDDEGREKVLNYVVQKYGNDRVAQIITFGTMAAKSSIRDVGRVLKLPLDETDRLAKLVPNDPGITLSNAFKEVPELADMKKKGPDLVRRTLAFAEVLEGCNRHISTHACGVIIGSDNLIDYLPLASAKDSDLMVTQYEGKLVEAVGMLKMDFLGLKTLSIIKDALDNIYKRHGEKIDIGLIPLDDIKTFELYQHGNTIGTFQFESDGMRSHLMELKPTHIEDLIAMNALYRPGPMEFIPKYIKRKHGKEAVEFPHPHLQTILESTFGIMIYQEQIMQTAQIIGGFSLGQADILRRAMGKKQMDVMKEQRVIFLEGAKKNGIENEKAVELFDLMQEFARYGFNRSHSAAYSMVAYQTAYLKAHYPAEYMASVLTHNLSDIKKITYFIDECRRQDIEVLGPDINESELNFIVNEFGEIRFGLAAIKGIGESAVNSITEERVKNGSFSGIFDLTRRINLRTVNKRSLEALAMAGAFDTFKGTHRAQYFYQEPGEDTTFLEKITKHTTNYQAKQNSSQVSLFGDDVQIETGEISFPECLPWTKLEKMKNEKAVTGFYMSGHPLDDFKLELDKFCNVTIADFKNKLAPFLRKGDLKFGGLVFEAEHKSSQKGKPYGSFHIEDYTDSIRLFLFSEDYLKMKHLLTDGSLLIVTARVIPRYNSETQLTLKVTSLNLLSEALDKLTSEVIVEAALSDVNDEFIARILKTAKANKGNCMLKVHVFDTDNQISVDMPSARLKVKCSDFIEALDKINVSYKLG